MRGVRRALVRSWLRSAGAIIAVFTDTQRCAHATVELKLVACAARRKQMKRQRALVLCSPGTATYSFRRQELNVRTPRDDLDSRSSVDDPES